MAHPTPVPIAFAHPQRPASMATDSPMQDLAQSTVSPSSLRWRGTPMSYKMFGSLNSRFLPGTSPSLFGGPLDANDFKMQFAGVPSSLESEHGRILRALNGEEPLTKDDMTQNYSCCGLDLHDLHALIEHFEEAHVVVLESPNLGPNRFGPASQSSVLDPDAMDLDSGSGPSSSASTPAPSTPPSAFDNVRTTTSRFSSGSTYSTPAQSRQHSPHPENRADALNPYASYSDFSSTLPGAVLTPKPTTSAPEATNTKCITPSLLFAPSQPSTPSLGSPTEGSSSSATASGSRVSTPVPSGSKGSSSGTHKKSSATANGISALTAAGPSGAASALSAKNGLNVVATKPFRCPKPGCNKSYKQANGLKYHVTHGQCNFQPRDPSLEGLNDQEMDQRARPFVCQVGACTRRYKNMNGLRYHYQHSGAHGAVGLALLAAGQHHLQTGDKDAAVDLPPEHYQQQQQQQQPQQTPIPPPVAQPMLPHFNPPPPPTTLPSYPTPPPFQHHMLLHHGHPAPPAPPTLPRHVSNYPQPEPFAMQL